MTRHVYSGQLAWTPFGMRWWVWRYEFSGHTYNQIPVAIGIAEDFVFATDAIRAVCNLLSGASK